MLEAGKPQLDPMLIVNLWISPAHFPVRRQTASRPGTAWLRGAAELTQAHEPAPGGRSQSSADTVTRVATACEVGATRLDRMRCSCWLAAITAK